jgi:hypothetical protein
VCIGVIAVFGATLPSVVPLVVSEFTRGGGNVVVPAQLIFGPAAFLTYLLLKRRYGTERTFAGYRADQTGNVRPRAAVVTAPDTAPTSPAPAPVAAARAD